ncbi:hypothetical protein [Kingella denitrificans]|nr:hypothetical protein [Kingella denitrificans]
MKICPFSVKIFNQALCRIPAFKAACTTKNKVQAAFCRNRAFRPSLC